MEKTSSIRTNVPIRSGINSERSRIYIIVVREHEEALKVLQIIKPINSQGEIGGNLSLIRNVVLQNACCRRAFIRSAFLMTDSISAPEKFYHFEIVCPIEPKAEQLKNIIATFDIEAEIVPRRKYYVVYIKEGSQIVDILNVMKALVSLTELENVRIVKEMRGSVNRRANCETTSINKTVSAAVK